MASYISQTEAAIFVDSFAAMPMPKALALLTAASSMAESYCNRTFTADEIDDQLKLAISMLGDWLGSANPSSGTVTSEKIGDYSVDYSDQSSDGLPLAVQMLLAPYRIIPVA
jgi:hypothetical protein